ncbi:hypothetical protein FN846DRAFT_706942 [Sphaerosporella brunnea]|uniref:Uncharacterized protein n=1 Tax=Sphaerosporella brunnea TaxID=1250544 RepID=A0A5J5EY31_9PEZI|nr:hypothetical protein FN846DRAFT_706834 [Sphaerosporella brunnea]KAA8906936.1 hypothetical protein FN846DRAFT_706942 [Sphaerosporella brunnea]
MPRGKNKARKASARKAEKNPEALNDSEKTPDPVPHCPPSTEEAKSNPYTSEITPEVLRICPLRETLRNRHPGFRRCLGSGQGLPSTLVLGKPFNDFLKSCESPHLDRFLGSHRKHRELMFSVFDDEQVYVRPTMQDSLTVKMACDATNPSMPEFMHIIRWCLGIEEGQSVPVELMDRNYHDCVRENFRRLKATQMAFFVEVTMWEDEGREEWEKSVRSHVARKQKQLLAEIPMQATTNCI